MQRPPRTPLVKPDQIEHHITDMTLTAGAQVTLEMIEYAIKPHQQWLPLDGNPTEPLAGLAIKMSTGPLRLGYGAWRDLTLGVQFEDGSGNLITTGGRVMKNVAGYDLTKLFIGSQGQLGTLISITFRTYRLPEMALHTTLPIDFPIQALLHTDLKPHWLLRDATSLRAGYLGDESAIRFYESRLAQMKLDVGSRVSLVNDIELRDKIWSSRDQLRASIPPANLDRFLQASSLTDFVADPAHGIVVARQPFDFACVKSSAEAVGGWAMELDHGCPRQFPAHGIPAEIFEKLCKVFDPDGAFRVPQFQ